MVYDFWMHDCRLIVALVAMDGWERVAEIWRRTKYSDTTVIDKDIKSKDL